jgi:hypothetical protein
MRGLCPSKMLAEACNTGSQSLAYTSIIIIFLIIPYKFLSLDGRGLR